MIRPRVGSFTYSQLELNAMLEDIQNFIDLDIPCIKGFVIGALTEKGEIDMRTTDFLSEKAFGFDVTFNRAFDITADWRKALEDLLEIPGITRILSSGHAKTACSPEGLAVLSEMIARTTDFSMNPFTSAARKVTVVPASGINGTNLCKLRETIPSLAEFHLSASTTITQTGLDDTMVSRMKEFGFGDNTIWRVDETTIKGIRDIMHEWFPVSEEMWELVISDSENEWILARAKEEDDKKVARGIWKKKGKQGIADKVSASSSSRQVKQNEGDTDVEELLRKDAERRKERREKSGSVIVCRSNEKVLKGDRKERRRKVTSMPEAATEGGDVVDEDALGADKKIGRRKVTSMPDEATEKGGGVGQQAKRDRKRPRKRK